MRISTINDIDKLCEDGIVNEKDRLLLMNLLIDAQEYSQDSVFPYPLEIHVVTEHTKWNPERTDPCPDYYGTYYLKFSCSNDQIVSDLDIHELDEHMCTLCSAFDIIKSVR